MLVVKGSNFTHSDQFLSTFKFHFPSDKPLKRKPEDQPASSRFLFNVLA